MVDICLYCHQSLSCIFSYDFVVKHLAMLDLNSEMFPIYLTTQGSWPYAKTVANIMPYTYAHPVPPFCFEQHLATSGTSMSPM